MALYYHELAVPDADGLVFGSAPTPLTTRRGLVIGGGELYPELNFTLPAMSINDSTWPEIERQYREIAADALRRAVELHAPGVVLECETLPDMTQRPERVASLCRILVDALDDAHERDGLRCALRMTPNDNREMVRPPLMRSGANWESMVEAFELCAEGGADLLAIESTGGKEVHDEALTMCDLPAVIFSLCVLGVRDMRFLWDRIVGIARSHGVHPAGDTACGFGNTAMVLAEQGMIPHVFAAVVRVVSAVRSLVAYECGAVGPGKDCGYENPILKAITGLPMSMEGKTAACAHSSPLGNIAAATCDLWSNESVQNIRLLGGMAPTVYMEQLIYDCRLMNRAAADGPTAALQLRDWLVDSDAALDPQAYVLAPENVIRFAEAIVAAGDHYSAGREVALLAMRMLSDGAAAGQIAIPERELPWLARMRSSVEELPEDETEFIERMMASVDTARFRAQDYDLA